MPHFTTNQTTREAAFSVKGRVLAMQIASAERDTKSYKFPMLTVQEVLNTARFEVREPLTNPVTGEAVSCCMWVHIQGGTFRVRAYVTGDRFTDWECEAPSYRKHNAVVVMEAVQRRIDKNREARLRTN